MAKKVRVVGRGGRIQFIVDDLANNPTFMKKHGLKLHEIELPEAGGEDSSKSNPVVAPNTDGEQEVVSKGNEGNENLNAGNSIEVQTDSNPIEVIKDGPKDNPDTKGNEGNENSGKSNQKKGGSN